MINLFLMQLIVVGIMKGAMLLILGVALIGKLTEVTSHTNANWYPIVADFFIVIGICYFYFDTLISIPIATLLIIISWGFYLAQQNRIQGCKCFGTLDTKLKKFEKQIRIALALCAIGTALGNYWHLELSHEFRYIEILGSLIGVFVSAIIAIMMLISHEINPKKSIIYDMNKSNQLRTKLSGETILGYKKDGILYTLSSYQNLNTPLICIFTNSGCVYCHRLLADLLPLIRSTPINLIILSDAENASSTDQAFYVDNAEHFRKAISVSSFPSLAIIDPLNYEVIQPVTFGGCNIYIELFKLLSKNNSQTR